MAGPFDRREYPGAAVPTTITTGINATDTSVNLVDVTGWGTGSVGRCLVVIDENVIGKEEKAWALSRTGTTLTIMAGGRGAEGTLAVTHAAGASIRVVAGATDFDEANRAVAQTLGLIQAKGDLLTGGAANTLVRTAVGADGTLPVANSANAGGIGWRALAQGDITGLIAALAAKLSATVLTAKGSLLAATTGGTPTERTVGADGTILTADSSNATGLSWGAVPAVKAAAVAACVYNTGTTSYPTRPTGYASVQFVGPVNPSAFMVDGDTWVNTA